MSTGTMDIRVAAIPAGEYFTAIREKETPRKGPKKAPTDSWIIGFRKVRAVTVQNTAADNAAISPQCAFTLLSCFSVLH